MQDTPVNDMTAVDILPIRGAVYDFATLLADTREFQCFEMASNVLKHDAAAQRSIHAYQTKYEALRIMLMLNAVSLDDHAELADLEQAFLADPAVNSYLQAEANLRVLCQTIAVVLSDRIGLDFAAACGSGCC